MFCFTWSFIITKKWLYNTRSHPLHFDYYSHYHKKIYPIITDAEYWIIYLSTIINKSGGTETKEKEKKNFWENIWRNQKYWTPNERMTLGKMAKTTRILLRLELGAIRLVGSWCGPSPLAHYDVSLCGGCGFALLVASQPSGILVDSCHLFLHVWLNHSCELWYSFFNYLFPLFPFMGWINVAGFCMSGNFWKYHIAGFIPFSESIYWGII